MNFAEKFKNFLNPAKEVKSFLDLIKEQDEEIKRQDSQIRELFEEYKEEERWRNQYTNALSLLTDSMQSMVWQKDPSHKYLLANPTHCVHFFGFDGTPECLSFIIGKTDEELIDQIFHKRGIENSFGEMCLITDKFVVENKKICHFFEKGIVEGIEILLYIVKIPQYDEGELVGTMGIGWDFSEKTENMIKILNRWKADDEIIILHEDEKTFCYLVEPESRQCEMFHHICPLPCESGLGTCGTPSCKKEIE